METSTMKVYACPTCGAQLETDDAAYRCEKHGTWYTYGGNLLVHAPSQDSKVSYHFAMPWEGTPQHS